MAKNEQPIGPQATPPGAGDTRPQTPERLLRINRLAMHARFVSGMAHEVNNSLQVIGGLVEHLADRTDLPGDVQARLQRIADQTERAAAAVRQVLAYTRGVGGHRRIVDLGRVVNRAVALRRYQLGRLGVELTWDAAHAQGVFVEGDELQLEQALLNLIVNAEEALDGAPERKLRITLQADDEVVRCIVSDSGPGIEPALRERVFEPFFTTRQSTRNVGLGLPAAAAIAAMHRGRVTLEKARSGATFVLELPRVRG
ncbi:MAG TPA: HAMP domain-containing sensor histidine kinase [Vicinamibacterales bacterium]|nr:HAMP domain-containing sensor histidine kinase [Vicinamibacterales bacterium]